mgnify:FL=1
MNGHRLLQAAGDDGAWKLVKTEPAAPGLKPGIYNFSSAKPPEKNRVHEGVVIHVDGSHVYQQAAKGMFVKHDLSAFGQAPAIGANVAVSYEGATATFTKAADRSRSRSR